MPHRDLMPAHGAACRPRRLLVFVNPFGGSRRAHQIWETTVRPVFDKAGIKSHPVETEHGGHASALLTSMPADELAGYDGVVAIGGDGCGQRQAWPCVRAAAQHAPSAFLVRQCWRGHAPSSRPGVQAVP